MAESETYRRGAEIRRRMLGDQYVQQSSRAADPVLGKFSDVAIETIWGVIWPRPGLDLKTKTLICVVSDAATGQEPELALHLKMALQEGWTEDELSEVLIHLLGYVGAPLVREAFLVARRVFEEATQK